MRVVVSCSVLHIGVAGYVCCSVLQCGGVCVLQCVALRGGCVLQCLAVPVCGRVYIGGRGGVTCVQIAQTAPQFKQAFLRNYNRLWRRHPLALSPLRWHTSCALKQRDKISRRIKRRYLRFLCVAVCCSVLQCVAADLWCAGAISKGGTCYSCVLQCVAALIDIRQEMTHNHTHPHTLT